MTHNDLEHDALDRLIVRELSRLPAFAPSPGFGSRVMAYVRLPEPRVVVALRHARAWVSQPRRAFALAGAYAACALIALGLAVPVVLHNAPTISYHAGLVGGRVLDAVRELGMALAAWAVSTGALEQLRSLAPGRGQLVLMAVALTVCYGAAIVALHRLLRSPRETNVPIAHRP